MTTQPVSVRRPTDLAPSWAVLAAILLALLFGAVGCGHNARNLSLDKAVAHDSLQTFLDTWKRGGTPEELKAGPTEIIVGDPDFKAGKPLAGYRVLPEEFDDGTNLHVTVELEVKDASRTRKKQVTYVVGTSPVVTIFPR
ncbi:MAG TPA: hypothetical protein VF170_05255 [Planctomycetaceae bacterium]